MRLIIEVFIQNIKNKYKLKQYFQNLTIKINLNFMKIKFCQQIELIELIINHIFHSLYLNLFFPKLYDDQQARWANQDVH